MILQSKLQYKNFETGEFIELQKRNYEETLSIIENFPWGKERDKIQISLTNPSVTVERENIFLKFAVYYNQKFVLYFLDQNNKLFTKSFTDFKNSYPYIFSFFYDDEFNTTEFKKENTLWQHNLKHFVTQDFVYRLSSRSLTKYLLSTSAISLCLSIFFVFFLIVKGWGQSPVPYLLFLFFICFFIGGGINLIVFLNYYLYAKGKILIMSKGNDIFYYGNVINPVRYNKKDIESITTYQIENGRNPLNGFAVIKLEFKDETSIQIPNIFINEYSLQDKLFEYPQKYKNGVRILKW